MAIRNIRIIGDEVLTKRCKEITTMTPRLKMLIEDMAETMYDANGVGLAACQVGVLKRIVVIDVSEEGNELMVFINPEILETEGEQEGYEGCLSVPDKSGWVKRPNRVVVKALNEDLQPFTLEGEGLLARAILHECEHLDGHLYVEHVEGGEQGLISNEKLRTEEE
ncbi:MAG: peptide deformylase [Lachnospiraceae bacterium]|nr:peptide deformylase [Lachnospiraceae bacterium]